MPRERYFLYIDGTQRGPYTVAQIDHMVNNAIVSPDSMFWCEGLDQWQPVSQLIVPKVEITKRRIRVSARVLFAAFAGCVAVWLLWPLIHQGWREQHQIELTQEAAYWRARGVLRDTFGNFTSIIFEPFDASKVRLHDGQRAAVELSAQTKRFGSVPMQGRWLVELEYDTRLSEWRPVQSQGQQPAPNPSPRQARPSVAPDESPASPR